MAVQEVLASLAQGNNLLLFVLLILLFVLAYRVLKAVINTAIVAVLSGLFYVALGYLGVGPAITVNGVMMFMVLGTALFILYSAAATLFRTTSGIVGALKGAAGWVAGLFRSEQEKIGKEKEIILEELDDDG